MSNNNNQSTPLEPGEIADQLPQQFATFVTQSNDRFLRIENRLDELTLFKDRVETRLDGMQTSLDTITKLLHDKFNGTSSASSSSTNDDAAASSSSTSNNPQQITFSGDGARTNATTVPHRPVTPGEGLLAAHDTPFHRMQSGRTTPMVSSPHQVDRPGNNNNDTRVTATPGQGGLFRENNVHIDRDDAVYAQQLKTASAVHNNAAEKTMQNIRTIYLTTKFSGDEEDDCTSMNAVLPWAMEALQVFGDHGRSLSDHDKIITCSVMFTKTAKQWFSSNKSRLMALPFTPLIFLDCDTHLTAAMIMTYINNADYNPTFITELIHYFRPKRSDADQSANFAKSLNESFIKPRDLMLKFRLFQNNLINPMNTNEVWRQIQLYIPEKIMADVRKEIQYAAITQSPITLDSLEWLTNTAQRYYEALSQEDRAALTKKVTKNIAPIAGTSSVPTSASSSQGEAVTVASTASNGTVAPMVTNGSERPDAAEQRLARLEQVVAGHEVGIAENRGRYYSLSEICCNAGGMPVSGGYMPRTGLESRGYTTAPDVYTSHQRFNASPRSNSYQQNAYLENRAQRGAVFQDRVRSGAEGAPFTPNRTIPNPTMAATDGVRLDMHNPGPAQIQQGSSTTPSPFGTTSLTSPPNNRSPSQPGDYQVSVPPSTPASNQSPYMTQRSPYYQQQIPSPALQQPRYNQQPQQFTQPPLHQHPYATRGNRNGNYPQNNGRYNAMHNGQKHVAAYHHAELNGGVRFLEEYSDAEAPVEDIIYDEPRDSHEEDQHYNFDPGGLSATGLLSTSISVEPPPQLPLHPLTCMLLKNSPSFTLHASVKSTRVSDHAPIPVSALLSVRVLERLGANNTSFIDSQPSLHDIDCKDASGNTMQILGILRQPVHFSLRASDLSEVEFKLEPHATFDPDNLAFRPTLICSYAPVPLILGIPWLAANDATARASTMSIHCNDKVFAKNYQSAHSKSGPSIKAVASLSPSTSPCDNGYSFMSSALPQEATEMPRLSHHMLPVWIPDIHMIPSDAILVVTPPPTLFDETGIYYTPMTLDRDNPCIFLTNSNLHSIRLSEFKEVGVVSVHYRGGIHTASKAGGTYNHTISASLLREDHTRSSTPPLESKPLGDWCTSTGDPLPTLDPSIPAAFVDRYKQLIRRYEKVFHNDFSEEAWQTTPADIQLKPGAVPYHANAFRLPSLHHDALKKLIDRYIDEGVLVESNSPWAAPCFFVPKPHGGLRFVVDYRVLNSWTVRCHWPLPNIEDLLMRLNGAKLHSVFDAHTGFHQQPMAAESQTLTSFITSFGQFMYRRLPMGLANAPSLFMRSMTDFIKGLKNIIAFVDDVDVYNGAETESEVELHENHLVLLEAFFQKCLDKSLKLNGKKGKIAAQEIHHLGHRLNRHGLYPSLDKVEAVKSFHTPTNVTHVKQFLGIVNYYRQWIKNCAELQLPLNRLTAKDVPFEWSEDCDTAFQRLKDALAQECVRHWPDPSLPYHLETDCSDYALGSVLSQYKAPDTVGKVLGYYSRSLTAAELNYAVFEKECLSIVASITHFHTYLACLVLFYVHTDHKSLATILKWKNPNRRISRWISTMSEYSFETRYRSGPSNANADALSRLSSSTVTIPDEDMPNTIICRDGLWRSEGKYDRQALGDKVMAFIGALSRRGVGNAGAVPRRNRSPVRVRNRRFQRTTVTHQMPNQTTDTPTEPSPTLPNHPIESTIPTTTAPNPQTLLDADDIFQLYGLIYTDNDTLINYKIIDVVFDQRLQEYAVHRMNADESAPDEDVWLPYEEVRRHISGTTYPTRQVLDHMTHFCDEQFRNAVLEELPSLFAEKVLDRSDVVQLPDEYNQLHYYRKFYSKRNSTIYYQLIIPVQDQISRAHLLRSALLRAHHDESGHFGVQKTYRTLRQTVFWKGMIDDVASYIKSCDLCESKGKSSDWHKVPILRHPLVVRPFQRVSVDLTGPFPKSNCGHQYIVMMVDHFTKWIIAVPIVSKDASAVADAIIEHLFLVYGPAEVLLADNGTEITANAVNSYIFQKLGSHLTNTSGYHPESNGQVERANQTLKNAIAKYLDSKENHAAWDRYIQVIVHAANISPSETTGYSPYFLLFGRECRRPIHAVLPDISDQHTKLSKKGHDYLDHLVHTLRTAYTEAAHNIDIKQSLYNKPRVFHRAARLTETQAPLYQLHQLVLIYTPATKVHDSKKLSKFWHGPYSIVGQINDVTYLIAVNPASPEPVNVNRMKLYHQRPPKFLTATRPLLV
jgi:hypothetical protein